MNAIFKFAKPIPVLYNEQLADSDGEKLLARIRSCRSFEELWSANHVICRFMYVHGTGANSRQWVKTLVAAKIERYTYLYKSFFNQ